MTYIDYLNRFWQIDIEVNFSGTESKLYFALLDIANKLHWSKTELSIPNNRLLAITGCSKNTLVSARNRLVQYELVKYVKGNRNKYSGKYILLKPNVGSIIDLTPDLTTDLTTDPTPDPNTDPYIRKEKIKKREDIFIQKEEEKENRFMGEMNPALYSNLTPYVRELVDIWEKHIGLFDTFWIASAKEMLRICPAAQAKNALVHCIENNYGELVEYGFDFVLQEVKSGKWGSRTDEGEKKSRKEEEFELVRGGKTGTDYAVPG